MQNKIPDLLLAMSRLQNSRSALALRDLCVRATTVLTECSSRLEEKDMHIAQLKQEYRILREANLKLEGRLEAQEQITKQFESFLKRPDPFIKFGEATQPQRLSTGQPGVIVKNGANDILFSNSIAEWWGCLDTCEQEDLLWEVTQPSFGLPKEFDSKLLGTARGIFLRDLSPEERKVLRNRAKEFAIEKSKDRT